MATSSRLSWVKVTHLPTGITVTRGLPQFRTQWQAREAAIRYLRSRLYMAGGYDESDLIIESVEVLDNVR